MAYEKKHTKDSDECVLLIGAHAGEPKKILGELDLATDEQFPVECVNDLSLGIERLRNGGVWAVVLDLPLPNAYPADPFDKLFQAAHGVPILILGKPDTEEMARLAVQSGAYDSPVGGHANGYRLRRMVRAMMERRLPEAVQLENRVADYTLDLIGEGVLRTDLQSNVTYLNRMAEQITGWRREEALGLPVADVLRMVADVNGELVNYALAIAGLRNKATGTMTTCSNCLLVRRDDVQVGIEHTIRLIYDPAGGVTGSIVLFRDVTAARATSRELSHLAHHDALTHLPNRILFNDRVTQAISLAKRYGTELAVLFIDLDHFKKINDSLGHMVGDKLLQSVAQRLLGCVRQADTVSRLGGDEFLVLLSQVEHAEDTAFTARKILRAIGAPHMVAGKRLDLNVSIGGSTYPSDGRDAISLIDHADAAMYEAKQHGRNSYQFYRPDMHLRAAKRIAREKDLRYALGRNELLLHYQPKINLQTGRIAGVEALLRWQHPQDGMMIPSEFVPIAEESGLIFSIGRWVLLEACKQARRWNDSGLVVPVSVNVSAAEFGARDFLSEVRAVLIATRVQPENLELELTESVLMQDAESAVVTLVKLKAMGVRISIDDFGTGYSSFTYLRRFTVDALKLDQSFVQGIFEGSGDPAIVSAIINLGRMLGQRVIAEGVETRGQLDFVRNRKCDEGQGYYFSRPVVAEQIGKLFVAGVQAGAAPSDISNDTFAA